MEDSVIPEQSIMLAMAALYIGLTEAIAEILGKDIEPRVNHHISEMMPLLPDEAADMCGYLLEFASPKSIQPVNASHCGWLEELIGATAH